MLGASALIALTTLLAKTLGLGGGENSLHPLQVSAGRFFFALITVSVFVAWFRPGFAGTRWGLHAARSACGWLGVTCMFAAAARMPLADATAISFLSPVVTMGLAIVMLAERIGPRRWAAAAVAVAGAIVLIQPGTDAFRPVALIALAAAFLMGLESVLIKRLTGTEPVLRILLLNNGFGAVIACSAALFVWIWPTPEQWGLLALLGVAMICGQRLFLEAMRRGEASHVIPAFYSTLVFATAYDFVLFGDLPGTVAFAGAGLIIAGVVMLTVLQARHDR